MIKHKFLRMLLSTGAQWDLGQNAEFKEMIHEINPTIQLPCESTMKKYADSAFKEMKDNMISILSEANRVNVTCDLWSSFNVSENFIGFTVHGFDKIKLDRFSFRLALRYILIS